MEWVRNILASRLAPLAFALGAVILLSWQVHRAYRPQKHEFKKETLSSASEKLPKAPGAQPVATFPSRQPSMGLSPIPIYRVIVCPIAPRSRNPLEAAVQASTVGTPKASHSMTMLSIRAQEQNQPQAPENTLLVRCRTDRNTSNSASADRIVVSGVVTSDVVSASGKILIAAGSKVAGVGQVDSDNGRIKSDGYWSIFSTDHELRVQAKMSDNDSGFPGIEGEETSNETELSQRQAVVRDGRYVFVPAKTPFVLNLKGKVGIKQLKILESPESP
jgi:hypothetical protein